MNVIDNCNDKSESYFQWLDHYRNVDLEKLRTIQPSAAKRLTEAKEAYHEAGARMRAVYRAIREKEDATRPSS